MFWILKRVMRFLSSKRLMGPLDLLFFRKSIRESPSDDTSDDGSGTVRLGEERDCYLRMQFRSEGIS